MILFCFLGFFPVKRTNVLQKVDFNGKLFSVTVLDQFLRAPNVKKNISPKLGLRVM